MAGQKLEPAEVATLKRTLGKQTALLEEWRERAKICRHEFTTQCPECGDFREWPSVLQLMLFCSKCGSKEVEILSIDGTPITEALEVVS